MARLAPVLVAALLAGCAAPAPGATQPDLPEVAPPAVEPVPVAFDVLTRAGGRVTVAGLAWWPEGEPTSTLLAVHGSGGVKENNWGPLPVPGYSLGEHEAARGRALVGIDLPGYGASDGVVPLVGMEDYAAVVDQVADALRAGSYATEGDARRAGALVGLGHSMGGIVVELAQGLFGSFDAVVGAGYVHGPYTDEALACFNSGDCPDVREICFWQEAADPAVVEAVVAAMVQPPTSVGMSIFLWSEGRHDEEVAARIDVPVLVIVGTKDWFYDPEAFDDEAAVFRGADDVTVVVREGIGHFVFHHHDHAEVVAALDAWLAERGL